MQGACVGQSDIVELLGVGKVENRIAGAKSVADSVEVNSAARYTCK